jgi:hypothetical protein
MEIYKDMIEKLKFHRNIIINAFIKKNYYPSSDEINDKLRLVDSRIALFESYISAPGSYMNIKELNYCFEMIAKDIEILYKVIEEILTNEFAALNVFLESSLSELESKADLYRKRCTEEIHSTALGTTLLFQSNSWEVEENDETIVTDLGPIDLVEGMDIACFADFKEHELEDGQINTLLDSASIVFEFDNNDFDKNFLALPYNRNNNSYKVPGELGINNYQIDIPMATLADDYIPIKTIDINFDNKYKIAGACGGMQVTSKKTGETYLYKFANIDNAFVAPEDCFVEFYILDGHKSPEPYIEYSFSEQPISTNFSLQDGKIPLKKDAVRIFIECQEGLGMFFTLPMGTVYASFEDPVIVNKNTFLYKGNWDIRDFLLREYVRSNVAKYNVKVHIKSPEEVVSQIESIYIKEVTS